MIGTPNNGNNVDSQSSLLHKPADISFLMLPEGQHDLFSGFEEFSKVLGKVGYGIFPESRFVGNLNQPLEIFHVHPTHSPIVIYMGIIHNVKQKNQ